ncbi:Glu/Leu/Phe/Val dehydrogenase dimerization domain-containing protein [Streptomyces sp. NPDC054766]
MISTAPLLAVTWTDPVTGRQGHLVIDTLVRGVASGGLRMRVGCTLDEVADLARGMTMKEALHYDPQARYVPLGGAKGGIDCDPLDPRAHGVLVRYLRAMRPYVENCWALGEDLGLSQDTVDQALMEVGVASAAQAVRPLLDDEEAARQRLADAFALRVEGVGLGELVGGCGVAESVLVGLERAGRAYEDTRVAIQGFGTMGGATGRFLAQAGLRVVAVADVKGTIVNADGLDVERLLAARDAHGTVDRECLRPGDAEREGEAWLSADAEVLVPAAVSYCIDDTNEARIRARWIVEAANLPVLPSSERRLGARGITVLPDVIVNSATNAWWWWTLFGDLEADVEQTFRHIRRSMRRLIDEVLRRADREGVTPRAAAHGLAGERLPVIAGRYGRYAVSGERGPHALADTSRGVGGQADQRDPYRGFPGPEGGPG